IEAGYPPELAYSECAHEVKLVIDLIYAKGFGEMYNSVSKTASYGGITRGNRLISDRLKADMKEILREVQSGEFATEWIAEKRAGSGYFHALVEDARESDMEKAGIAFREILEKKSE
ncbi:MAG: ketol-acid reductoisomerase, partial [Methanocorpusculum sp.]|nr:ketol-acid reductoisomerase [Methanocorpusculum sp.]